jgi:hypothetical protein
MYLKVILSVFVLAGLAACEPTSQERAAQENYLDTYGSRAGYR